MRNIKKGEIKFDKLLMFSHSLKTNGGFPTESKNLMYLPAPDDALTNILFINCWVISSTLTF